MNSLKSHADFSAVEKVYHKIHQAGYQVLLAGGCVRDGLLGLVPRDFDLATNALPEQIEQLFAKTVAVGKAFGVILVIEDAVEIEVATFRSDEAYVDGRRPTAVHFSSPEEDAKRRDFTVNALFYDLINDKLLDWVEGQEDLRQGVLRAVGDAERRFSEDHLRLLRAVRFVGQLGFSLEVKTRAAVVRHAALANLVSGERLREEMEKLLLSRYRRKALQELVATGILQALLPASQVTSLSSWQEVPEDRVHLWISFWLWNLAAVNSEESLRRELLRWKFSNVDKSAFEKALRWHLQPSQFISKSLGELVELCFDSFALFGLQIFVSLHSSPEHQEKWQKLRQFLDLWQSQAPEPLVRAADLQDQLQGASLGKALKEIYWQQLEGRLGKDQKSIKSSVDLVIKQNLKKA